MEDTTFFGTDAGTLVERVMQTIRQRIAGRTLAPGAKVPSIRGFVETLQVSKSTVVEAYDRLAAEGIIQSRRGSGAQCLHQAGRSAECTLMINQKTAMTLRTSLCLRPCWRSPTR